MSVLECSHLRTCVDRFHESERRLEALSQTVANEHAQWRPKAGTWSIAQCLEHLVVTMESYSGFMERAIKKGRRKNRTGRAPYGRGTWVGRFLLGFVTEEPTQKVNAPPVFQPQSESPPFGDLCQAFRESIQRLGDMAQAADGLDLGRLRVRTPVSPFLRVSLAQAFELHATHNLRHLGQAERLTRMEEFPGRGQFEPDQ